MSDEVEFEFETFDPVARVRSREPRAAELIGRIRAALSDAEYFKAAQLNQALVAECGLTVGVTSELGWKNSKLEITLANQSREPTEAGVAASQQHLRVVPKDVEPIRPEPYRLARVDVPFFGSDGWGIYAGDELVGVIKGQERATAIYGLLERVHGLAALKEWTGHYEAELARHDDHALAVKHADAQLMLRFDRD
jgi:hypothetical protein